MAKLKPDTDIERLRTLLQLAKDKYAFVIAEEVVDSVSKEILEFAVQGIREKIRSIERRNDSNSRFDSFRRG